MARLFAFIACLAVAFAAPSQNGDDANVAGAMGETEASSDVQSDFGMKGFQMANMPMGKGFAYAGKGNSMAAKMQMEAMVCPMTTFQLAKAKKEQMDTNMMMEAQHVANAGLQAAKLDLEEQLEACRAELALTTASLEQATTDLASCREALAAEKAVNEELRQQLADTQDALAAEQEKSANLADELAAEQADNAQLRAELAAEKEDNARLNAELAAEKAENARLAEELSAEKADNARLEAELAAEKENSANLAAQLAATQAELADERKAREILMATMGIIETTADEAQTNVNELLGLDEE